LAASVGFLLLIVLDNYACDMSSFRYRCRQSLTVAALLLPIALAARAAETNRVKARFEIYVLAGLHVLTEYTTVEETGDRYAITADLATRGFARLFVDLTSHSEVRGTLAGGNPSPYGYRAEVRRNGTIRHYGVDYRGQGAVTDVSSPPSKWPSFVAGQIRGTVDQITAYFMVERQLARRGTCALNVLVFNGAEFYYLRFRDARREMMSADGYQDFAAPAWVCDVERRDLADNPDGNQETYRRGKIWYARVTSEDRLEPIRMEFDTSLGVVKGYLAELHGRGVDLHLIKE
jgi:hypothetical protein